MRSLWLPVPLLAFGSLAVLLISTTAITSPGPAKLVTKSAELEVPSGCDQPATKSAGGTYYIDPERGSDLGDGSADRPWATLAGVLRRHQRDFRAGDRLLLASGDHGVA